jgi:hypothetical protein
MARVAFFAILTAFFALDAQGRVAIELAGSRASMERQNRVALESGLVFTRTFEDIDRMVAVGQLVELHGNEDYDVLPGIRSNAARPEVREFVERLAADYHAATGEKLVVTSLTRPSSSQPRNASPLSVHPAGISVDLRVSQRAESRAWIESHLLDMEARGLLDVTREYHPPHYHIAIFPDAFMAHVSELREQEFADEATAVRMHEREVLTLAADILPDIEDEPVRRSFWSRVASFFRLA